MEEAKLPKMKVIENGKLWYETTHEMKGVTPEMMRWYSTQYGPTRDEESYKMWHPDHIALKIPRKSAKGGIGSIHWAKERVGKYTVAFTAVVEDWTDTTHLIFHRTLLYQWRTHSVREFTPTGLKMRGAHIVGSDNPAWGRLWNLIMRRFIFTEELRAAHVKHADEEFQNTEKFVKKLWAEHISQEK